MDINRLGLPRAIIFDWDHTLVDTWDVITLAINETRGNYGMDIWSVEQTRLNATMSLKDSFPKIFGDRWKQARSIFVEKYNKLNLAHLKTMPGSQDLLSAIKHLDIPLFVVSNKQGPTLRQEAEHLGWTVFFAAIVGSMDAKRDKPERDPVDKALHQAGMKADDPAIWFVGDSESDVKCARNAGCTSILIDRNPDAELLNTDLIFSDCHELQSLLYSLANNKKSLKEA